MNTTKYALAFGFLFAAIAAGCGSKSDASSNNGAKSGAAFAGTCNKMSKLSKCDEYNELTMGLEEGACKELGGTFSTTAACPTDGRVGVCKKKSGTTYYYNAKSEGQLTPEFAKLDCENPLIEGKYTDLAPAGAPPAAAAANDTGHGNGATAPASTGKAGGSPAEHPGGAAAHAGAKGHKKGK